MSLVTTTTTCVEKYTSVTLAAGEQFVLPPGAILIAATDETAITDDGCLDRSQLEELVCARVSVGDADPDTNANVGEADPNYSNVVLNGISIGNTEYPFVAPFNVVTTASYATQIALLSVGGIIQECNIISDFEDNSGNVIYYDVQTLPSFLNAGMYFYGTASSEDLPSFPVWFKFEECTTAGCCSGCETDSLGSPAAVPLSAPLSSFAERTTTTIAVETTTTTDNITTTTTTEPDVPTEPSV
jgi:hypothetical protein